MSSSSPSVPPSIGPVDALRLEAEDLTRGAITGIRWMFGIGGLAAVAIGIALLVWPVKSLAVAAILLGLYFVIQAVVRLIVAITTPGISAGWRILDVLFAVLFLIGGVFMMRNSVIAAGTLAFVIVFIVGIGWIADGILALVESARAVSPGWAVAFGLLSIVAGVVVVAVPGWSAVALVIFTGASAVVTGVVALARAFTFGRGTLRAMDADVVEGHAVDR